MTFDMAANQRPIQLPGVGPPQTPRVRPFPQIRNMGPPPMEPPQIPSMRMELHGMGPDNLETGPPQGFGRGLIAEREPGPADVGIGFGLPPGSPGYGNRMSPRFGYSAGRPMGQSFMQMLREAQRQRLLGRVNPRYAMNLQALGGYGAQPVLSGLLPTF